MGSIKNQLENFKPEFKMNVLRRILQVVFSLFLMAAILFLSSGTWCWLFAWILLGVSLLIIVANSFILPPELISERGQKKENVEKWDNVITRLIILPWLAIYLISGLDYRYRWSSEISLSIRLIGLVIYILGNALITWAMVSNFYFSTAVRLQYERGHKVSNTGPYALIRHPGYLGMMVYHLATPIILGSIWALIPAFLTVVLFIIRTILEDRTLKAKLEGYKEYAERVKYRLIPGLW